MCGSEFIYLKKIIIFSLLLDVLSNLEEFLEDAN